MPFFARNGRGPGTQEGKKMELFSLETVRTGLMAGALVALLSSVLILAFSGYVVQQARDLGEPFDDQQGLLLRWIGTWIAVSMVFGVLCAVGFSYVSTNFNWGIREPLLLAIGLAITLTVLAYMPLFEFSRFAPYAHLYSALNFAFALGFGYAVPKLAGA